MTEMENKLASLREALGEVLIEIGTENNDAVVVGADTTESIRLLDFGKRFPERFFNVGIAEQNMIGISSGLAFAGKTVFCGTYIVFLERAIEQIRNTIAYCNLNVKLIGAHGGISVGPDGGSHQAIEDISIMRALPNMKVVAPSDAYSTKTLIREASRTRGPFYIRIVRPPTQMIYKGSENIRVGRAETILEGEDIAIIANGILVSEAIKAAHTLKEDGVSARVIDCHTIKPIDAATIIKAAKECGRMVTAEDHNVIGGMGSAVAEVLSREYPIKIRMVGVKDVFGESGNHDQLIEKYGLSSKSIVSEALSLLNR